MTGIYIRVSTQEQAVSGYSIDEQEARARAYCLAMGWDVADVYIDGGFSGSNMDRPALRRLLDDIRARKLRRVLVYKLDRLSRSQLDTLYLIEQVFLPVGVDFVSMSENFDTSTPFGKAMIGILAVFAQLEREQITERMTMGRQARVRGGRWHGSDQSPVGYIYKDDALVQIPDEVDQVREAFRLCLAGVSTYSIAETLNAAGFSHRYGQWNAVRVREVLRNPVYIGKLRTGGEIVDGKQEPCVDPDVFHSAQLILDRRRAASLERNSTPGKARSILGGFLVCKRCGAKFHKQKNGTDDRLYYVCASRAKKDRVSVKDPNCKNKRWPMEDLDRLVLDHVASLRYAPPAKKKAPADDRGRLEKKKAALEGRMSRLMDLYAVGGVSLPDLQKKVEDLRKEIDRVAADMATASKKAANAADSAAVDKALASVGEIVAGGDFERIRAVLSLLVDRVEIDGDDVEIFYAF